MKTHSTLAHALFSILAGTAATHLGATPSPPAGDASIADHGAVPEGLSPDDWANIRAAYESRQARFATTEQGHEARTASDGWLARFDGKGFHLGPDSDEWSFGLELDRYGFETGLVDVDRATGVRAQGQRLSYDWGTGLSEWWVNDSRGLEHGFTVHERPSGGEGALLFDVALRGNLQPSLLESGRGLRLVDADGAAVLTYDGLIAFDADGTTLEAWLEVTERGVRIAVLEEGARYPLTVDPVIQSGYLKASNTGFGDAFGRSVAVSGDTVVVGSTGERSGATGVDGDQADDGSEFAGAAYVYVRSGSTWIQQAYLKASNTDAGDLFGSSVAISGDTLVVGATAEASNATGVDGDQSDNSAPDSGAVYVFVRTGSTWSQEAYLKAPNAEASDGFGGSVAVSGDTVVVAAEFESSAAMGVNGNQADNSAESSGAAYVFVRDGVSWSHQAYLKASNTEADDRFGWSVSVSGDVVVVGAPFEDSSSMGVDGVQGDNSAPFAGAAYVFARNGVTWAQQGYLKASNTDPNDLFGQAVSVSDDTLVVGAGSESSAATGVYGDQSSNSANNSGAAYVFVRQAGTWGQQAYLKASNTESSDFFGEAVSVSRNTIVVGATLESSGAAGVDGNQFNNSSPGSGAAYVFGRNGSFWTQQAYLKASNPTPEDFFGVSVAVSDETVIVGAHLEDSIATGVDGSQTNSSTNTGAAYAFDLPDLPFLIGTSMCRPAGINSTGVSGNLTAEGSGVAADNNLTFRAVGLPPNQMGFLINSKTNTSFPTTVSDGLLCHGPSFGRHSAAIGNSGLNGVILTVVDLTALPRPGDPEPALAGQTWYFQFWYRDGPGSSNLTNSVEIFFQ